MKKITKILVLKLLSINSIRIYLYKFMDFLLRNFQEDRSNTYDLTTIKRIGGKEGEYSSNKIVSFLKNNIELNKTNFLDIGCGDLFLCEDLLKAKIEKYFGFDLNNENLKRGLNFLKKKKVNTQNIFLEQGNYFDFKSIKNLEIDIAFSQAVCSHLSINSLIVMFKRLKPKMKKNGLLLSSFIIVNNEDSYNLEKKINEWKKINKFSGEPHNVTSFFLRDPYHYDLKTITEIAKFCGWNLFDCRDYDHDLQKMLFFKLI